MTYLLLMQATQSAVISWTPCNNSMVPKGATCCKLGIFLQESPPTSYLAIEEGQLLTCGCPHSHSLAIPQLGPKAEKARSQMKLFRAPMPSAPISWELKSLLLSVWLMFLFSGKHSFSYRQLPPDLFPLTACELSEVRCHVLFMFASPLCVCWVAQSCLTLCDPMDYPARFLCPWDFPDENTGVSCHLSRRSSRPRDRTHVSCVSCTAGRFFTAELLGKLTEKVNSFQVPAAMAHERICLEYWGVEDFDAKSWLGRKSAMID